MEEEISVVAEHRFPCDACGSDLRFDPEAQQLRCNHCGNVEEISGATPTGGLNELDYEAALTPQFDDIEMEETRVVTCTDCGAATEFDADLHAAECPFCASPVVTDTGTHRHIKPGGLLPFRVDESLARYALNEWLGSLWFAPDGLKEYARKGRKMNGIYVPFWTFDAATKTNYSGQRGTHYYETVTVVRDGKRVREQVRKTRWRGTSGRVARFFDDMLVLASQSLPKKHTDGLEPWDLSELEPYKTEYLAGFRAEAYQVELSDGFRQTRDYMDRMIRRDIKRDIGGDDQRIGRVGTQIENVSFKHVLLPVWLAAYKYRGRTYRFVVNGRTGRVQGERPYSAWKIAFAVVIGIILALIAGFVIANSQ